MTTAEVYNMRTIYLAGGCFWGILSRNVPFCAKMD